MRKRLLLFALILLLVTAFLYGDDIKYGIGDWDADKFGNHRIVVQVDDVSKAALVKVQWRRRDLEPEKKDVIIIEAATGKEVESKYLKSLSREVGEIVFQPDKVGKYYLYYMPYTVSGSKNYPTVKYHPARNQGPKAWLDEATAGSMETAAAQVLEIQSVDKFNSFSPMEVIATEAETKALVAKHTSADFLAFPEDRKYPIRMTRDLPLRWIKTGARTIFPATADKGEFYAFQVGLYAFKDEIKNFKVKYTGLKGEDGSQVPASAFRCFNLGGTDWTGEKLVKQCSVDKGRVRAIWFGVQIPENIKSQIYKGTLTIIPRGMKPQTIGLNFTVSNKVLKDAGDSEPWKHSRLRWLDSTIADDKDFLPPFTPVEMNGNQLKVLGRKVVLADSGIPASIKSFFDIEMTSLSEAGLEILDAPMEFIVEDESGRKLPWQEGKVETLDKHSGEVSWKSSSHSEALEMNVKGKLEFDGNMDFQVTLKATKEIKVKDIRLQLLLKPEVVKYMLGLGHKGGYAPTHFQWKWDQRYNQDSVWLGDVNAGFQISFRDENYVRPLNTNFYHEKPLNMPPSWFNDGNGGIELDRVRRTEFTRLISYSGRREIKQGEELHFNFKMLLTPFKLMDTKAQWNSRFFHKFAPVDEIKARGANVVNVHHATDINPFINYPFLRPAEMKAYIDEAHAKGLKVKIYYTVRELSNMAPELFALRSLGNEILSYGPGGGFSWLQEHVAEDYIAAWFVPAIKDAAIINSGVSRWHNYYLEGLNWLVKNVGIDGLYIDDVAFDRYIMKRARKILDRNNPGSLIDLHSANQFNYRDGYSNSVNLYMEHLPFIDRLWFGEYFDYNEGPDYWMTEVAGIPFGLMGEMLEGGGNPWRGMIYGMTSRMPWSGNPSAIWKAWEDFGISESRMIGYWVPHRPVKTDHSLVLVTTYLRPGKALISIASWEKDDVMVDLLIDWKSLGIKKSRAMISAPAIADFQKATSFEVDKPVPVKAGEGWLLVIEEKK